jgi:hypothetical protein
MSYTISVFAPPFSFSTYLAIAQHFCFHPSLTPTTTCANKIGIETESQSWATPTLTSWPSTRSVSSRYVFSTVYVYIYSAVPALPARAVRVSVARESSEQCPLCSFLSITQYPMDRPRYCCDYCCCGTVHQLMICSLVLTVVPGRSMPPPRPTPVISIPLVIYVHVHALNGIKGHPGAPMGLAPAAHVLFNKFMNFTPKKPKWANRDRFVLSYVAYSYEMHVISLTIVETVTDACCNTLCSTSTDMLSPLTTSRPSV